MRPRTYIIQPMRFSCFNRSSKIIVLLLLALVIISCLYLLNTPRAKVIYTPIYMNLSLDQPVGWKQRLLHESKRPVLIGEFITSQKFLTIGISSTFRSENYLKATLQSFIDQSTSAQRKNVTIVVFLADLDIATKKSQVTMLVTHFKSHMDSGFIQVIYSEQTDLYPPLTSLRHTYNDSTARIEWRSKQVLDFAFLLSYASNISEYYMVMEDDIIAAPEYLTTIRNFIETSNNREHPWIALEFTEFLCIGLTFHSTALDDLPTFLLLFYNDQPVDYLMRQFIDLQVPDQWSVRRKIPSIFQHVGIRSTLKKKKQQSKDYSFETAKRKFDHQNPPAILTTTMMIHEECFPQNAYEKIPGIFWGIPEYNKTEYVTIHFSPPIVPIPVTRVYIRSGGKLLKRNEQGTKPKLKDMIHKNGGELEYSDEPNCKQFSKLDTFMEKTGILDTKLFTPMNMTCIRLVIHNRGNNGSWVIISEIEIFTEINNKHEGYFLRW